MSERTVGRSSLARRHRAVADPRSAACALGLGSIVLLGFGDGGYYATTWRWAGLALAAVAGLVLVRRRGAVLGRLELLAFAALGALAAWMRLSSLWGIEGTEAAREAERCVVYAVGLGAFVLIVRHASARSLLSGVLVGTVVLGVYALADRHLSPPRLDPYQGSLLKEPVGYANALGILMALGVVLALGLLTEAHRGPERCMLLGAASVSALALALTSSRGAGLAALVGLVVLGACRFGSARVLAAAGISLLLLVLVAIPRVSFGDRPHYWRIAVDDASDRPLLGSGAGSFDDYWLDHRPIPAFVRDAHSLYLETAAELGVAGLALLLCALGTPLVAAAIARDRQHVAPALAAYAAFLVHAGLDWDWEMPVTMFAGLACGAALFEGSRGLSRS